MIYKITSIVFGLIYLFLFFSLIISEDLKILGIGSLLSSFFIFPFVYKWVAKKYSQKNLKLKLFALSVGIFILSFVINITFLILKNPEQNKLILNQSKSESFSLSNTRNCGDAVITFNKTIFELAQIRVSEMIETRFIDLQPKDQNPYGIRIYCEKYEEDYTKTLINNLRNKSKEDKNFRVDEKFQFVSENNKIKNQFSYLNPENHRVYEVLMDDNSSYVIVFQSNDQKDELLKKSLFKIDIQK